MVRKMKNKLGPNMRFHTTLANRMDDREILAECGWNVLITLTLLGLTREEPRFRNLPEAPFNEAESSVSAG
jgi:hypothetical protein